MVDEKSVTGTAVVIGAGTMGGGIAAQLANAGWQVRLLDVAGPDANDRQTRNQAATAGLMRMMNNRPPLLFLPEFGQRVVAGNTADNLDWLRDADWVVEAVAERMDVKQRVMAQIEAHARPQTVVSSNTSGLSLQEMTKDCSADFRTRFFGTHFLNPPRYLKLLELIPTPDTDPKILEGFLQFAEQVLGHRVVIAKDTPGFISTRIWIEHLLESIRIAVEQGLSFEETDYLTGALLGRPRSATFRMADLVGVDIIAAISANQYERLSDDPFRDRLQLPAILQQVILDGLLGEKSGAGFYKREGKAILALDLVDMEYRPRQETSIEAVEALLKRPLAERFAAFASYGNTAWGRYVNAVLDSLKAYVEYVGPVVASDALSVDNVMRWGFQWEIGPFEIEDLRSGQHRFYERTGATRKTRVFGRSELQPIRARPEYLSLADLKSVGKTMFETPEGAMIDLGDGVACLEFHTKMNTFSPALCATVNQARERAEKEFLALVIGNEAPHFSAGYNLKLFLDAIATEDWDGIDAMLRDVQSAFLGLKYASVPVVAAPHGYTLGAGCECCLQCAAIQAGPELAMGLPELAVGLVPGGGGVKETLARAMADWDHVSDAFPRVEQTFALFATSGNSGSAAQARKFGFLRETDSISRNADRLLFDAKQKALALANAGYRPPVKTGIWVMGQEGLARLRMPLHWRYRAGQISEHDRYIADWYARILSGGDLPYAQEVSEEYLLELERYAFQALVKEPKSIARMRAILETGKPLKN